MEEPRLPRSRPRVLWVTAVPPAFEGGGGPIRQAHLLDALAKRAEVHLAVSGGLTDSLVRSTVSALTEIATVAEDRSQGPRSLRRVRDLRTALVPGAPREVAAFGAVRRAMLPVVAAFTGDVVVVEFAGLADLVRARRPGGPAFVLTLHNVASEMAAEHAAVAPGRRQRWLYRRDATAALRWEQAIVAAPDRLVVVSEEDRRRLGSPPRTTVVANGVDLDRVPPGPLPTEPRIVFTGALHTGPNIDGARWFCTEILSLVRRAVPDACVSVVGSNPPPDVRAMSRLPGVSVEADVPTIGPHLRAARVAVVPLRIGSGTRLKALEALAAGRPVVGTTVGLAGLGLVHGRHALIADEAAAFAAGVVRLLGDGDLAGRLVSAGRELAEGRTWDSVALRWVDVVLGAASTGA